MGGMSSGSSSSTPKDMTPKAFRNLQPQLADILSTTLDKYVPGGVNAIFQGYQGPTTANITGRERGALSDLDTAVRGTEQPAYGRMFSSMVRSGRTPEEAALTGRQSVARNPTAGPEDVNPYLDAAVAAGQRETQQTLEETLGRTLPGRFALAGQQSQPQSSSAFDRAAAIATRGAADALGDISTNMRYANFNDASNREAAANLQTQQLRAGATESAYNRALAVPQIQGALNTQQVDNMVKNLQAQALPRLIKDMGIERGMEAFNQRVNSLLSVLGVTAGVTRPVIANESESSQSGFNIGK